MAARLVWLAHAPTTGMRELVFGDDSGLAHRELVRRWPERAVSCWRGPEPACVESAQALGVVARLDPRLANFDPGSWRGCTFAEVLSRSPTDLSAWLSDPAAAPHGGESLADLVVRVGAFCDQTDWSDGPHLLVVSPLVARAAAVHALGAPAKAIFRVDVAPLQRVTMSRSAGTWRLIGLGSSDPGT